MNGYLLDTHALVWWTLGSHRLSDTAKEVIIDPANQIYVSIASIWEIAIKYGLGKMDEAKVLIDDLKSGVAVPEFAELPITSRHAIASGELNIEHRDPFDRLLIAQAREEGLVLISNERMFDAFGVERLWK